MRNILFVKSCVLSMLSVFIFMNCVMFLYYPKESYSFSCKKIYCINLPKNNNRQKHPSQLKEKNFSFEDIRKEVK